jgi:hypothetical protein
VNALLHIEPTLGPVSRVAADIAVVAIYESDRPLQGSAGWADWRLCGQLSALIEAGRFHGSEGEALLLPAGGGMRVPLLLALGCGDRGRWDASRQQQFSSAAVSRVRGLGLASLTMPIGVVGLSDPELGRRARALLVGAAEALVEQPGEMRLRLIVPRSDARRVDGALRAARPTLQGSVLVRFPEPDPRLSAAGHDAAY